MATAARRLLTADEFLMIEWEDSDIKAELDNGIIRVTRMMAGGTGAHARIQRNILVALHTKLSGTGCGAYGPDMASRTHELSVRYPDVSVFCGREDSANDALKAFDDPRLVVEVLSPSTRERDEGTKLHEYQALHAVDAILYVDPQRETVRLLERTASRGWTDGEVTVGSAVELTSLGIKLEWAEIFARR